MHPDLSVEVGVHGSRKEAHVSTEAKISLAVGLSFIICFAIVLTNRGRPLGPAVADRVSGDSTPQRRNASNPIRLPDKVRDRLSPKGSAHSYARGENPRESGSKRVDSTQSPRRLPSKPKRFAQRAETPPGSAFTRADVEPSPNPILPAHGPDELAATGRKNGSRVTMGPPASGVDPSPLDGGLGTTADDRASTLRAGDAAPYKILALNDAASDSTEPPTSDRPLTRTAPTRTEKAADKPTSPSRRSELRHTVLKGESLWSIVQKNYGRATGGLLNAVFEANRETLDSPDRLKVGTSLLLPEVNGHAPLVDRSKTVGDGERERTTKPPGDRSSDRDGKINRTNERRSPKQIGQERLAWRWYQVADGDRYATIAASELGSAKQWPTLFELNKDIFPDPDRIRGGVNIRIPLAGTH